MLLRKGSIAVLSTAELHRDEAVFGVKSDDFDATRFLKEPKLANNRSFKPFGSGTTFCPGREFALQETLVFVALLLHRYDVQISGSRTRPQMDQAWLAVGLSRPVSGTDLTVEIGLRSKGDVGAYDLSHRKDSCTN